MAGLLAPYIPDAGDAEKSVLLGNQLGMAVRQQDSQLQAGQRMMAGDTAGAQAALYGGGNFEQAQGMDLHRLKMEAASRQAADWKTERALKIHNALTDVATQIETPEQFESVKAELAKTGLPVQNFTFADLPALKAQALDIKTRMAMAAPKPIMTPEGLTYSGQFNPQTSQYEPISGMAQAVPANPDKLRGEDYLKLTQDPFTSQARAVMSGREPMPVISKSNPQARAIQQLVREADPDYNENRYKYMQNFMDPKATAGPGYTRIANNTALGHARELAELAQKIPDVHLGPMSNIATAGADWWRRQWNDEDLNNFTGLSKTLADEVAKVNAGKSPALASQNEIMAHLNPALGRKALLAVIAEYTKILAKKTDALRSDYRANMGQYAPEPQIIDPENQVWVNNVQQEQAQQSGKQSAPAAAAPVPSGNVHYRYNPQTQQLESVQ